MRIEKLRKSELEAFVMSEAFTQMEYIPVSRHRAVSQVRNPRAKEEDILLLIAYEDKKMQGYLGLLPDDFRAGDTAHHVAWMSTIWVHPGARGRGVARRLLDAATEAYRGHLIGTEFTPEAKAIYLKTGLFDLFQKYEGIRLYYRFNLRDLLPPKNNFFRWIKPLLPFADSVLNILNDLRPKRVPDVVETVVKEFDEWTNAYDDFIHRSGNDSPCSRNASEISWVIKNPWILETPQPALGKRYHFTSAEKRAHFQSLEIRKEGKRVALLLLFIRGNAMKIPYAFVEREEVNSVCAAIDNLMVEKKLSTLTVFHPVLKSAFQAARTSAFKKRPIIREYVIGIPFHQKIGAVYRGHFQDGDGDCAFT